MNTRKFFGRKEVIKERVVWQDDEGTTFKKLRIDYIYFFVCWIPIIKKIISVYYYTDKN